MREFGMKVPPSRVYTFLHVPSRPSFTEEPQTICFLFIISASIDVGKGPPNMWTAGIRLQTRLIRKHGAPGHGLVLRPKKIRLH